MSTTQLPPYEAPPAARVAVHRESAALDSARRFLAPLASLRLTVFLLGLSIVLVLAGTLAQMYHDVWYVVHAYFRVWIAWIKLYIFFPRAWAVSESLVVPFPGGKLIGAALAANLVAAHTLRFKIAAHGPRLWLGWATIALGAAITYMVVASGSNTAVESELSASFANNLWHALRAALGGAALTLVYVLALTRAQARRSSAWWLWLFGAAAAVLLACLSVYLFAFPAARLDASGLRILWQLAKATAASVVLGAGCWAVFGKRAGIVLLHGGIGLMMFTELYTAQNVVEARMSIEKNETAYFAEDIRSVELAVIDASDDATDRTTVIPGSLLLAASQSGDVIRHDDLPFDVRVVKFLPNARTRRVQPREESLATAGVGQLYTIDGRPTNIGVATEQAVDLPAAVVELLAKAKDGGASQGTYLASLLLKNERLAVGDKPYEMGLRFRRIPKPYRVTLEEFKFDRYIGSDTPKNFESVVRFEDPAHSVNRTVAIWMNNPLRYGGDTLYQADWNHETEQGTVLQVVTNSGWMVPYVACMIVAAGMLVHFLQGLVRFVLRREDESRRARAQLGDTGLPEARVPWPLRWRSPAYWVPALVVLAAAGTTAQFAMPRQSPALEMKLEAFGGLPVVYGGRTQPMDSLARNTLRVVSGKATYKDQKFERRQPAIRWFLDVVSRAPAFRDHRVIRIENLDVLQTLGLRHRPGDWRYSLAEIYRDVSANDDGELSRQVRLALAVPEKQRDLMQQKFIELDAKTKRIFAIRQAFDVPEVGERGELLLENQAELEAAIDQLNALAPKPVLPATPDGQWLTVFESTYNVFRDILATRRAPSDAQGTTALLKIMKAYRESNAADFNAAVDDYGKLVSQAAAAEHEREARLAAGGERGNRKPAERLVLARIAFESFFNRFDPFVVCLVFYVVAFVLAALSWVAWSEGFNRAANWLLWFTFALHTFGLICRIYISGRPPVTNLYSSAVFIGWAGVLFALLIESIYRLGIGNLLAAALGFPTMVIAYQLTFDNDGDTLGVMQAVLDTNFWLSTHVVCIALGYATTLFAGIAGLATLVLGDILRVVSADVRRQFSRITYGILCFAIFFSFVGTVLGGLWADDSWGRFWGWDPKENGALMIVLWNAIVLHARWGKLIGQRGLASLAVLGNIVVAWSWWGVNQLSIGLHNYGWTAGLTFWLVAFALSQIAVVAVTYAMAMFDRDARPTAKATPA